MHVGVIGTGAVGTSLSLGLESAGHDVVLGSRSPSEASTPNVDADVVDHLEAIDRAEAIIPAVPPDAAVDLSRRYRDELEGKTVIDPTNEYPDPTDVRSVAQRITEAAPGASVAKAFNSIGAEHMRDPAVGDGTATMFVAGEMEARDVAEGLAADIGFDVVAVGGLDAADRLEDLGRLWIDLSIEHGREVAYHLLRG